MGAKHPPLRRTPTRLTEAAVPQRHSQAAVPRRLGMPLSHHPGCDTGCALLVRTSQDAQESIPEQRTVAPLTGVSRADHSLAEENST